MRQRLDQHGRRQAHVGRKHPRQAADASRQTDPWVVLFTSHQHHLAGSGAQLRSALGHRGQLWRCPGRLDGRHGWDLETTLARAADVVVVERVVGLWALGALVQTWVGHRLGLPSVPAPVPLLRRE